MKPFYWDRWQADDIRNQSVANLLVDWVWMSGKAGINIPQAVLGVKVDGIVGDKTIQAVNQHEQVLSDIHLENSSQTSWEEIVVITSDSLPVVIAALLNYPASLAKGIYIHKKKQLIENNQHQKQAITTQ